MPKIRIVLVETSHPGNIGATARAMKNMGFNELALVRPKQFPHVTATSRAAGADDILTQARIYPNLAEAVADCHLVVGTSARPRSIQWPQWSPKDFASRVGKEPSSHQVAVVFGRERSGLTNEELDLCHQGLYIPCNPDFSSLNVAAAVQIIVYELRWASNGSQEQQAKDDDLAIHAELESFYIHIHNTLNDIGFLHSSKQAPSIMRRLRRLFGRIRLEKREVDILRGILSCAQRHERSGKTC